MLYLHIWDVLKCYVCHACSVVSDFLWVHGLYPARLLCPLYFSSKSTGMSCHFLFQNIFLIQGSNPCLLYFLHWQANSLPLFVWYMYQEHLLPLCGLFFFTPLIMSYDEDVHNFDVIQFIRDFPLWSIYFVSIRFKTADSKVINVFSYVFLWKLALLLTL